jgi:hypothetical protein
VRERVKAIMLITVLLLSMYLCSLPSVYADYTVSHASFPPDFPGDVKFDGVVDIFDVITVALAFGSVFGGENWNALADTNDDGLVDIFDLVSVTSIFGKTYSTSTTPIAYSTSFEFTVPDDGDEWVWYYLLMRIYVPSGLAGKDFSLTAGKSVDDGIRNVKIDNALKSSGQTGLFNITLGQLAGGFHLLELEYGEAAGSGLLNFTVKTSANEYAWLDRFRIYVPNYNQQEVRYTVRTQTYFPGDDFFLGGYADDYIDDVMVDVGLIWQDWEWNCTPYDTIYAWGDGFMYPLGWQYGTHPITFTFGEINATGLLDFQYISWTNQRNKIGLPKFYASTKITNLGSYITLNEGKIYAGSRWVSPEDPEISERTYEILTTYNVSYRGPGGVWLDASLQLGVGNNWTEWGLTKGSHDDVGIPLNFTVTNFDSNLPVGHYPGGFDFWWNVYLTDYTIDVYSFPLLRICGMECDRGDSKGIIGPDWTIPIDFGGQVMMFVASSITPSDVTPIGSMVGLGIVGLVAVLRFVSGQAVSGYTETVKENTHRQLTSNFAKCVDPYSQKKSRSDLVFLGLEPTAGKHCGLTKVVLKGTLLAIRWTWPPQHDPIPDEYPIGDIEITLCVPWFLWE